MGCILVFFGRVLECLLQYILSWVWDILMVAYWVWEEYLVLCRVLEWLGHLPWGFCCCKDINSVWNLQYVLSLRPILSVLVGYILFCADAWCPTYNMNTWYYVLCCYVLCWFLGHTACILCFMLGYIVFSGVCWPFSAWSPRRRWSVGLWCFLGHPVRTGSGGCTPTYSWCPQLSDGHI